jgi:hypothetical protein
MNKRIFSPFLLLLALIFVFAIMGCGGASPGLEGGNGAGGANSPSAPESTEPVFAPIPTQTMSVPSLPTQAPVPPAINETRRLTLEFPSSIRAGVEGDVVRLTLEVDDLGNITPTAKYEGNVVVGETIQIPDLYETHLVTAEAQLDLAGFTFQPPNAIYEPLKRGQSVTFLWSISPQDVGKYRGTVWLHLNFENRSTGEKERVALSAQIIEIQAVDFFGMSFNVVRAGGVIGSIISGVVGFPFIEDIIKFVFNRRKRKK